MTVSRPAHQGGLHGSERALLVTDSSRPRPGVLVLTVRGELDLSTEPLLEAAVRSATADPAITVLVCDLSGVTFMSCGTLSILVRARSDLRKRSAGLRVVAKHPGVVRVFTITGMAEALDLRPDLATACQPPLS
jgi:anti-sigma B factor antagonist